MSIVAKDAMTVELLARRARYLAAPLVEKIPGGELYVEAVYGASRYLEPWHVSIGVFRALPDGSLAPMVLQAIVLSSTSKVDAAVEKLRAIVEAKSWPLAPIEQVSA